MTRWLNAPTHVDFNVTNACNLACSHCHSASGARLPNEFDTEGLIRAVEELHALGVLSIVFAGGEPFVRRDMSHVLAHACALPGWKVSVVTNGTFLARGTRAAELFKQCPGLHVNVSLDGSTPGLLATLRHQAGPTQDPKLLFDDVTSSIRRCAEAGFHTSVNFTVTSATAHDLPDLYALAIDELGADGVVAIKFFPAGFGLDHLDELDLTYRAWSAFFSALTTKKLEGGYPKLEMSVAAAWEFYLPLIEAKLDLTAAEQAWRYRSPLRDRSFGATHFVGDSSGIAELAVGGDGQVYPSVLFYGLHGAECGRLLATPAKQIWEQAPALRELASLTTAGLPRPCQQCALVGICGGGSRARAFGATGRLDGPDVACPLIDEAKPPTRVPQGPVIDSVPVVLTGQSKGHAPSQPRHVIGSGETAIRVYATPEGCEVRAIGYVVHGNTLLRDAFDAALSDDPVLAVKPLSTAHEIPVADVTAPLRRLISLLSAEGFPIEDLDNLITSFAPAR